VKVRRALLSVWDKAGLAAFARALDALGVELISTGGTAAALEAEGLRVTPVSALTGFPELLGGRVKTLHPAIAAAVLARPGDEEELAAYGVAPIDLVVVTLYPFARVAQEREAAGERPPFADLVEWIDIGGVTLLRAAAKNWARVGVVSRPDQYEAVAAELRASGTLSPETRRRLAADAFALTAAYDAAIAVRAAGTEGPEAFPDPLVLTYRRAQELRYGENPHQRAALYLTDAPPPGQVLTARVLQGKALSYNNLVDLDAAWQAVREFAAPAAVVVKHATPCGAALGRDGPEAIRRALDADPVSAFGGIVAVNRPLDAPGVEAFGETFLEAVIAPEVTPDALARLAARRHLRVLDAGSSAPSAAPVALRWLPGGVLVQEADREGLPAETRVVTRRAPGEAEWADLRFAWLVCKHVRSNAIVLASGGQTVGIGAGQMSRVDSVRLAAWKAGERARGAVLASDAFFPFPDGVEVAATAGVTAVIQPGGSVRDREVIAAADAAGIAMVLTGVRHFRH
jgi:phosphoribosylaminoimidazolecarboxamide formyltransferase/IMP cyclohydrolase